MRRVRKSDRGAAEPYLPGLAVRQLDGLFFSIFPDQAAALRIANTAEHFRRAYGLKGAPLSTDRFHVEVAFDRVTSFAGSDALVLRGGDGVDGIVMFHHTLGVAMRKSGLSAGSQFTPHVTLLYDGRRVEEQFIEPIRWTVRDFVLVHSLRGRTMHIPLERWHLGE
jgi:2'-5' RNA ligase